MSDVICIAFSSIVLAAFFIQRLQTFFPSCFYVFNVLKILLKVFYIHDLEMT